MLFSLLLLSSSPLFLFLLSFSFVGVILELMALKKPAFRRLFTQMTVDFVRLVFKKPGRYIYSALSFIRDSNFMSSFKWLGSSVG